jgi:hypothetical protein
VNGKLLLTRDLQRFQLAKEQVAEAYPTAPASPVGAMHATSPSNEAHPLTLFPVERPSECTNTNWRDDFDHFLHIRSSRASSCIEGEPRASKNPLSPGERRFWASPLNPQGKGAGDSAKTHINFHLHNSSSHKGHGSQEHSNCHLLQGADGDKKKVTLSPLQDELWTHTSPLIPPNKQN